MKNKPGLWLGALLLALGIAGAGWTVSDGLQRFKLEDRSVTIKGLAEADVESDFAAWNLTFRRAGNAFADVQQALAEDRARVTRFLTAAGFRADEVEIRPLQVQDAYSREYGASNQPLRYTGSGLVIIQSDRVDLVEATALAIDPLIEAGVEIEGGSGPRYQLRGFNEIKPALLAEATRNAREQAEKFAAEAGAQVGVLRSANQGVIRITGSDGNDWDDGSSRMKRLRVVSTFQYSLE